MADWLLMPEGWGRGVLLGTCAGVLALLWTRRTLLGALDDAAGEDPAPLAPAGTPDGPPLRSLLIVAKDEEERLPGLLRDLEAMLDEDPGLEILLGDDHSRDGTRRLLDIFALNHPRVVRMDAPNTRGKSAWLAAAVPRAQGAVLLFSDADCRLPRRWSLTLAGALERGQLAAAGGPVLLAGLERAGLVDGWQRLHWLMLSGVAAALSARSQPPTAPSLWGGNLAVRASELAALGGHAALGAERNEDLALARSLADKGRPLALLAGPRPLIVRTHPVDLAGCGRQLARWLGGLPRLGGAALAVLAAWLWLAAWMATLLVRPALGLLLGLAAAHALANLLSGLAARLDERPVGPLAALGYLAALPVMALAAFKALLDGSARGPSRTGRP